MRNARLRMAAAVAALALSACTAPSEMPPAASPSLPDETLSTASSTSFPSNSSVASTTPSPVRPAPEGDPPKEQPTTSSKTTDDSTPVVKVQRSGEASEPSVSASPGDINEKIAYTDGVVLHIDGIQFGEETKEGPGRFPGRSYAILSLEMNNGSMQPIDLNSTVVTVIDASDQQIAPVYVEEADVSDFSGQVQPGETSTATYAFAVAKASRSQVTVVVDFDGLHTSAVFQGELR